MHPSSQTCPNLSSISKVDAYLSSGYPAFDIKNPLFNVSQPYPPHATAPILYHAYTWSDELHINCSYPEAFMGSDQDRPVAEFVNQLMKIINKAATKFC